MSAIFDAHNDHHGAFQQPIDLNEPIAAASESGDIAWLIPAPKQGGFILNGRDHANINLMHSQGGARAMQIFKRLGDHLRPLYLSQQFFDAHHPRP
ncbi:MAG: hypothetical protein IPK79_09680 [Vampirovibrionales bacterium]|nr:hypothetical protein [Vampirovibrionales bacterium]